MAAWKLPLIVAALVVPIVAAFALGGGGVGVAVGALTAVALVVVAARQQPRGPIGSAPVEGARRVLLVATSAVEEPAAVRRIAAAAGIADGEAGKAEVRVLAPAKIGFLDRWTSDVEGARQAAQRDLVATVAALAKAGIAAEARVGDEDVVQAVEDQLQGYAASDVVLISTAEDAGWAADAAAELGDRLRAEFHHVVFDGG
jgi:hypothetical protein